MVILHYNKAQNQLMNMIQKRVQKCCKPPALSLSPLPRLAFKVHSSLLQYSNTLLNHSKIKIWQNKVFFSIINSLQETHDEVLSQIVMSQLIAPYVTLLGYHINKYTVIQWFTRRHFYLVTLHQGDNGNKV